MKIHMSEPTMLRLSEDARFVFVERGVIEVKVRLLVSLLFLKVIKNLKKKKEKKIKGEQQVYQHE